MDSVVVVVGGADLVVIPAEFVEVAGGMAVSAVTVVIAVAVLVVVVTVVNLGTLLNGNNYLFRINVQRGSINKKKKFSSFLFSLSLSLDNCSIFLLHTKLYSTAFFFFSLFFVFFFFFLFLF